MSSELDDSQDWELGEFDESLEEFDEFDVRDGVTHRTVILRKEHMVALLCLKTATVGAAICRVDPRESMPAVQIYDDVSAAKEWFTKSLRTSRENGWHLIYDGLPLKG
ncbi:MAG: hypothetical protein K1X52_06265 [Pyrinomonadaceae bacterium]|nr:hypothetical protein [Pyrinomonadaceae bacterium]